MRSTRTPGDSGISCRTRDSGSRSADRRIAPAAISRRSGRAVARFPSPRAWPFALLGIDEYLQAFQGDSGVQLLSRTLADRLFELLQRSSDQNWPWFQGRGT